MSRLVLQALTRAALVLYGRILRFYPASFRDRCGAPMMQTFEQLCAAHVERGRLAPFMRAWFAETADAIRGIRRSRRGERSLPPLPHGSAARDSVIGSLCQDAVYAVRRLRAQPSVVFFTVLTLGFSIAANAAIFSIVDAVMLRPSAFADPDRLVTLMNRGLSGGAFPGMSREKLRQWRTETDLFEAVEGYRRSSVVITGGVEPEEVAAAYVSAGLVKTLGVSPLVGRIFLPTEGVRGEDRVVLVSERYWRARLGGAADALGRSVSVNGTRHTIVGVMPERFRFPTVREQVWMPFDPAARTESGGIIEMIVRLAPGVILDAARKRADAIAEALQADRPLPNGWGIALFPARISGPDDTTRRAVVVLFGAVALVLLTACANVANLLLSRAVDRQREFAIRLVLGASRARLFRELLIEGLVLGVAAGAVGLLVATWAIDLLIRVAPASLIQATASSVAVDSRVFGFTLVVSLLTGVACNLAPALRTARTTGPQALAGRSRTSTDTPFHRRMRGALVVTEIALAVVLLVGAALMVRTFVKLNAVDIGFDPDDVLAVTVGLDRDRYATEASRISFLAQVTADARQLPGVSGVALVAGLPPQPGTRGLADPETDAGRCGDDTTSIVANVVGPSYFGLMGMRIVDGRAFHDDDGTSAVVVSRSFANLCGRTLVGRRVRLGPAAPWLHVVGIAADVKSFGLTSDEGAVALYAPLGNDPGSVLPIVATMHERRVESRRVIIRADRPGRLIEEVKRLVWSRDPQQPILDASLATDLMGESVRRERFMLTLMTLFSAVALALASAGIFGVLAYSVAQRTSEIGIRMALGASSRSVLRLVVGQALGLAAAGVVAGVAGAFALSRVLAGLLYEVDPHDPATFLTMPLLVLGVALLAAWIPTTRALRVDPASALRVE